MNFMRSRTRSRRTSVNIMASTEKWRSYGRKLSRRNEEFLKGDSIDDLPQVSELKDWVEDLFTQKNIDEDQSDEDTEVTLTKKQTLILSTLVPDEILLMDNFNSVESKRFVGVLMMADVSGYTALSEKYSDSGKSGTYRLTVTLNTYLGSLIELIYSHGGDIIKFAGDAFLALWKTDKRTFLCHTIHTAIACALIIQHSYGSYETDVKVNLKVKLAISAGNLIFSPIGSGIDMNYVIIGLPVLEAKIAESQCKSGEVKLTPTAWGHCYSRNYDHIISDDGHVTIKAILYDPHEKDVSKPFLGFGAMLRQVNKTFIDIENLSDIFLDDATAITKKNEWLSLRKTILTIENKNIGSEIRKFMIRPVLTQIDAHQPLEYLTEMRQVSVLFVTLKPKDCSFSQLITIVNNSYKITCEIVYKSMGCVNKIILFDKDIMILVIFGLRGFKHESEAQAALKCAFSIKKSVSALDGVLEVSIGVTTGQVYCGVVGHPLRREFTVIGAIVNKAARFMCGFRNKITCDEATFVNSKMSSNAFTLQPPTELKGIIQPGKIYEYTEEIRVKELYNIPLILPLLNRADELEYFKNWLEDRYLTIRDFDALLLVGENRIGKSRLIEWMARYARSENISVCFINLTSIHSATPYLALSQIVEQIMGIKEPICGFEKEEKIVKLLKCYSNDLCYLNNILKVRFAYHEGIHSQREEIRKEKAKIVFKKIINSISNTYIMFLDDLQNLDSCSWEFLSIIFNSMNFFTVLTITRGKFTNAHSWLYSVFMNNNNIRKLVIGSLSSTWISALACQILDVHAVANDLCEALLTKCNGMPGLVESFIVHLFSNGALEIIKIHPNELDSWTHEDLQFPDPAMLLPLALNAKDQTSLNQLMDESASENITICFVTDKDQLNTNINLQNVDTLLMMQLDSLTPYQQLLLKIASVIGNVLSRDLLESIMYENDPLTTAKAIKRLFVMRILCCASQKYKKMSTVTLQSNYSGATNLSCDCAFEYDSEMNNNLPKYAFCKIMRFRNTNSKRTFYELLPLNQKKEFHSRIVNYLENNKQKCPDCGGILMIVQSSLNIQVPYNNTSCSTNINLQFVDDDLKEEIDKSTEEISDTIEKLHDSQNSLLVQKCKSESLNSRTLREVYKKNSDTNIISTVVLNECPRPYTSVLKIKSNDIIVPDVRRSTKQVKVADLVVNDVCSELIDYTIFDMLREVTEVKTKTEWQEILGIVDSEDNLKLDSNEKRRKSLCIILEKGVSQINFNKCTCSELNIIIYEQLIRHAQEAEMMTKAVEFLILFCYLNVMGDNFEIAIPKLEDAETICLDKNKNISDFDRKRFLGKIFSLQALSFLLSGRLAASKIYIEKAARIYKINLKNITDFLKNLRIYTVVKLKRTSYQLHYKRMKKDCVFFLNVATILYSTLDEESTSRIAALRSIDLVQRVDCDVIDLCDAFTNAIHMELNRGVVEYTIELETMASNCFKKRYRPVQANELFSVGKLLHAIFRARLARGQLAATIRSGYRALVISRFLYAEKISADIIPDLFYLLLCRYRIEEAINVVKLLRQLRENLECETWYYALCIDMILDAGFQLESPNEISRYAKYSLNKGKSGGESRRRLVVGLWTYWLRADCERKAKSYETEVLSWSAHDPDDGSLKSVFSSMRFADGMLESLARKVDDLRKVVDLMELRSLADRELTKLERDARLLRAIHPRWLLLRANTLNLSGRQSAASTMLSQALEEARKTNNRLEEALVAAASSDSRIWFANARNGYFPDWSNIAKSAQTSWHQILYKMVTSNK